VSALGAAGIKIDIESFSLHIDGASWINKGVPNDQEKERIKKSMSGKNFTLDIMGEKYLNLYKELLSSF